MKIFNISFLCIFFIAKSMLAANPELVKKYGNMVRNYELNITNQNLGDEDAFAIAEVVSKDRTLNGLHLSDNKIGDAGALALAKAIEKHPLLMRISLSNNNIGDKGGVAFADMIKNNVVINSLDLLGNKEMGNETAEAFAQALKKNRALSTLYLDSNIMTDTGATAIADALKKDNFTLTEITVFNHGLNQEIWRKIDDEKKINQEIIKSLKTDPDLWKKTAFMLVGRNKLDSIFYQLPKEVIQQIFDFVVRLKAKEKKQVSN